MDNALFNRYSNEELVAIIIHSVVSYFPLYGKTLILLSILLITYASYVRFFDASPTIDRIRGGSGGILFLWFLWRFYRIRLDAIILLHSGLQRLEWSGIFDYHSILYERDSIVSISHRQDSVWDSIFDTGDMVLTMEDNMRVVYNHVSQPQNMVAKISEMKADYDAHKYQADDSTL